jgi:GNAT superfamily N-acetyltransferase
MALFREGRVIISIPPNRNGDLRRLLSTQEANCTPASFARALTPHASVVLGPAFVGYAERVPAPEGQARSLDAGDAPTLEALRAQCGAVEWEHGGSPIEYPCSGVFQQGRLVALAGYEIWGGTIAHISVITHPDFRGQGLGRSAVAHVAQRAIAVGLLPQYRTLEANRPSMRIAESLGFRSYATSVAARFQR